MRSDNRRVPASSHSVSVLSFGAPARARAVPRPTMLQICAYPSGAVYCVSEVYADSGVADRPARTYLRTRMIATPLRTRPAR